MPRWRSPRNPAWSVSLLTRPAHRSRRSKPCPQHTGGLSEKTWVLVREGRPGGAATGVFWVFLPLTPIFPRNMRLTIPCGLSTLPVVVLFRVPHRLFPEEIDGREQHPQGQEGHEQVRRLPGAGGENRLDEETDR